MRAGKAALGLMLGIPALWSADDLWVNPLFKPLAVDRRGFGTSLLALEGGRLMTVDGNAVIISSDDGRTWPESRTIYNGPDADKPGRGIPSSNGQLFKTAAGVLVLVWRDTGILNWDFEAGEPGPHSRGDVWSIRSLDGGQTWIDRQVVFEGTYGHPPINMIQTRSGRLIVPVQYYVRKPGRLVVCTYASSDNGKTWRPSNVIDLGGHGDHDGAFEPVLVELKDGRIWALIRTSWDRFWEAFSEDSGLSWRVIRPSSIEASSSPAYITRLASGRLVLVWNRLYPEGQNTYERQSGHFSSVPASWHREELSIAFSEDEGQTWSAPAIIARRKHGWIAYPYVFERAPGLLWIFTGSGELKVSVRETDLVWWKK
jgi:hypothetical protein